MDETEKGSEGKAPEEKPAEDKVDEKAAEKTAQQAVVEALPSEPPRVPPAPSKRPDWVQIGLIVLSVLVVLLLASTITLAVTGHYGRDGRGGRHENCYGNQRGPMMRNFQRGQNQDGELPQMRRLPQNQSQQSTPAVPTPQAPAPTQ
jgi:hypothetical protein